MQNLEKLAKVLRYAGLNLTPQMLQLILDKNARSLIDTINSRLTENPNLSLDDIDEIISQIQQAAEKEERVETPSAKPALEQA